MGRRSGESIDVLHHNRDLSKKSLTLWNKYGIETDSDCHLSA
jgi:hypothetical protein